MISLLLQQVPVGVPALVLNIFYGLPHPELVIGTGRLSCESGRPEFDFYLHNKLTRGVLVCSCLSALCLQLENHNTDISYKNVVKITR